MPTTTLAQDLEPLVGAQALLADLPDAGSLVRLGAAAGLEFHRVLALLLKRAWENVCPQTFGGGDAQRAGADIDLRLLKKRFAPDCDALFDALEQGGYVPHAAAYDPASLHDTVREMVLLDLHVLAADGPELRAFAERNRRARSLLQECPLDVEQALRAARHDWLVLQEELSERLLYLERCRLANERLALEWLAQFGAASLALTEAAARLESLQRRIEVKLARPALTREELDRVVGEAEAAGRLQRNRLRQRLALATTARHHAAGTRMSAADVAEYRRQSKQALREIWLLIHPDKLTRHAQYARLTAQQRDLLAESWHRAMAVRDEEIACEPGCLGHDFRSLTVLLDIVATVRAILDNAGIDTDVGLIVQGDTADEQLAWLRNSTGRLVQELDGVQAELIVLLNDPERMQRTALLEAPAAKQEDVRGEMASRAASLGEQADRALAYLDRLFAAGPATSPAALSLPAGRA